MSLQGLQDLAGALVLNESRHAQIGRLPAGFQRDLLPQGEAPVRVGLQGPDQAAHHVVVAQALAGIFAGADPESRLFS